jgi:retron-type reverse transcriptase
MKIIDSNSIKFELSDMTFVEKFGIKDAAQMVFDYKSVNETPFVFDCFQLSNLVGVDEIQMFHMIRNKERYYRKITLKKKNGGTRKITAPDFTMKCVQGCILYRILNNIPVSKYATAYHKGATLYDNAAPHTNKKYILKLDITDFFGSITFSQVLSCVFNSGRYPKQTGYLLTELCTLNDVLPQGAPTSPAVSNIVMKSFDDYIGKWCEKNAIAYTRYCDDMTFSSDKPLYHVYKKAEKMLNDMGFWLNESKTKFISASQRQTVTGLTVNEKVSVPREYKRELRQQIHYLLKYDFDAESVSHAYDYGESFLVRHCRECFCTVIGKVKYVLQIEPDNAYFKNALEELHRVINRYLM